MKITTEQEVQMIQPDVLLSIIESELGMSVKELKEHIKNIDIQVTEEILNKNVDDEIKERMGEYAPILSDINFYRNYINIIKNKCLNMITMIDKLGNNELFRNDPTLTSLDINIGKKGSLNSEDIIRIIEPTVYNIRKLENMHDIVGVMHNAIIDIVDNNIIEGADFTTLSSLSIESLEDKKGFIPLSKKQKAELKEINSNQNSYRL